jgi:2-C-methyl-D-erythritol 4-phosphate cytidylyltransferase
VIVAVALVVPAAGTGSRFGGPVAKQFLTIDGRMVLAWTLTAFRGLVDEVVLVGDDRERLAAAAAEAELPARIVAGGASRQQSVANGLAAVTAPVALIHDAVRPCVPRRCIAACIAALADHPAAVVAVPCSATVKRADGPRVAATVPRDGLWLAQTPQGVRLAEARPAYARAAAEGWACTDDAEVMERAGHRVAIVAGDARNLKLTTPDDLAVATALLRAGG